MSKKKKNQLDFEDLLEQQHLEWKEEDAEDSNEIQEDELVLSWDEESQQMVHKPFKIVKENN
jgi:hypothetical protein